MPLYQTVLTDANQISYHNTVVARSSDAWWLGNIQDIDGNYAFIHFNSIIVQARWMHMKDVWHLPSYWDTKLAREKGWHGDIHVFAALREEYNGPFCFRPAVMLNMLNGCNSDCKMFCIRTDVSKTVVHPPSTGFEVVHFHQVASALPPSGPSLLDRRSGFLYEKHFIPFVQTQDVLRDPSDKLRIIKHINDAIQVRFKLTRGNPADRCHFHLRFDQESCILVIARLATDTKPTHWMVESLPEILGTHLGSRVDLPPINNRVFLANEDIPSKIDIRFTACVRDLTPPLLSDILSHLDLHSQMRARRVCALWQLLLSSPKMMEHISISFESCWHLKADGDNRILRADSNNCFKATSLLSRSINSTTISLTILRVFPPHHILQPLLEAMEIKVPLLVLKDHITIQPVYRIGVKKPSRLKHGATDFVTSYKNRCNSVLLLNWKVSGLFGLHMYDLFEHNWLNFGVEEIFRLLPDNREWILPPTYKPQEFAIDKLQITIPKLLLPCSDGSMPMASRMMCALNDGFSPVTEDIVAKVTAVHARWVSNLTYPEDWQSIRDYLLMFSGFEPDGRPKVWEEIDLRVVDLSTWSKMATHGINEVFRV
ncbi:uncharacterized protein LOC129588332 isoform X2 [Paramacrobiotus metropolitanus]|nr:uncharacterized protein LOC129588332 isoform X2 [Paramacrobiotus metropolitanus]XP_055338483.1 uncharacterized protein LOC129588332 isoform X2 [Paramacrobiotus metropolitanus]XP_055338484.1 uncharacterized protein LOC129588332 isoform X2 [Paramacrobiotus metropolitanus]